MCVPRSGWVKPESDRRLSDLVSVGLLTRVFPADVVDAVIADVGRTRGAAAGIAGAGDGVFLDRDGAVFGRLLRGRVRPTDRWFVVDDGWMQSWSPPTKSAIFQARSRLGFEPVRELFARVAHPVARADTPGSWLAGRRLVAIDGTCVDVPDTPVNADFFGRPAASRGEQSAFPQARLVAVAECGTHAVFDAVLGPCRTSEIELARELVAPTRTGDAGARRPWPLRIQAVEPGRRNRR